MTRAPQTTSSLAEHKDSGPILEVRGVHSGYPGMSVLRDVSLSVERSSAVALLGANGVGKTTLLKTICGLIDPTAGCVLLDGNDVTRQPAHRRQEQGLCYIPEGRGIFRSLTVRENLRLQAASGHEEQAIEVAVEAFPVLGKRLGQRAGTMSGGEQQMLALAQAYVGAHHVILVDEPSLGLAPRVVDEVFSFLELVKSRGASLLVVDQFAHRVLEMATTAYLMQRGQIVYAGSTSQLLESELVTQYLGTRAI